MFLCSRREIPTRKNRAVLLCRNLSSEVVHAESGSQNSWEFWPNSDGLGADVRLLLTNEYSSETSECISREASQKEYKSPVLTLETWIVESMRDKLPIEVVLLESTLSGLFNQGRDLTRILV